MRTEIGKPYGDALKLLRAAARARNESNEVDVDVIAEKIGFSADKCRLSKNALIAGGYFGGGLQGFSRMTVVSPLGISTAEDAEAQGKARFWRFASLAILAVWTISNSTLIPLFTHRLDRRIERLEKQQLEHASPRASSQAAR